MSPKVYGHRYIQCILAYPNPFGSLAQNFVQISEMFV